MFERRVYLKKMELSKALEGYIKALENFFNKVEVEEISVIDSTGRVTAEPVYANVSVPSLNSAAMDGIAVRSIDTFGANETSPVELILEKDFEYINTGNPLPEKYDAVIMIENVEQIDEKRVLIRKSAHPYMNVRKIGEDICAQEMIFPRYREILPQDVSFLLSADVFKIKVLKKMKVAFIPTGDEIVKVGSEDTSGKILETNSYMVKNYLEKFNCIVDVFDVVPDDIDTLTDTLKNTVRNYEMILINAGSSAGSKDFTYAAIEQLGIVLTHGLNLRPAKPVLLGLIEGKPVIGLPGYPVACYMTVEEIVKPIVLKKNRLSENSKSNIEAHFARKIQSPVADEEHIRVGAGKINGRYVVFPLKRGSANISSLSYMDGVVKVPIGIEVLEENQKVTVNLLKSRDLIDKNIVILGSHDLLIDLLSDFLKKCDYELNIVKANVGSLGGISMIRNNFAHMAGIHLFDPESEEYNVPYLKKFFDDFVLLNLSYREQGFIVQKGNPKNIKDFTDLKRVRFINRQRSAGTRILFDYYLKKYGISPDEIVGYKDEEYSHVNLALKIKKNMADVGMGIKAAAKMFDLDFIPVANERYDLLINKNFLNDWRFDLIVEIIKSKEFKEAAQNLGGYDMSLSGQVIKG